MKVDIILIEPYLYWGKLSEDGRVLQSARRMDEGDYARLYVFESLQGNLPDIVLPANHTVLDPIDLSRAETDYYATQMKIDRKAYYDFRKEFLNEDQQENF